MIQHTSTATLFGIHAQPIRVEAHVSSGLSKFNIVGLPDAAVKEARDRVRAAMRQSKLPFPHGHVTINLAPAVLRKQGTQFDLPIALSILCAQGIVPANALADTFFFGELSLDGRLGAVHGVLSFVQAAKQAGARRVVVPEANLRESLLVDGIESLGAKSLGQVIDALTNQVTLISTCNDSSATPETSSLTDFAHIKGQETVKRALEVSAAGAHNILLSGVPGSGKTMLARSLPTILPPLATDEILEVTTIHSIAGTLSADRTHVHERPFRSPHHSSSAVSIVGGGNWPKPGEVSLAHRGVLFLDELPEFPRHVLEHLRQPLEDGEVTIARAAGTFRFPARFMLVAAMNPCPCGFATDPKRECTCTSNKRIAYQKKLSGPLIDRIDLHCSVARVETDNLLNTSRAEASSVIQKRVVAARAIQRKRLAPYQCLTNSEIPNAHMQRLIPLGKEERVLMHQAMEKLQLSARSYTRIRKIARTIADLAGDMDVKSPHLMEALQYRPAAVHT